MLQDLLICAAVLVVAALTVAALVSGVALTPGIVSGLIVSMLATSALVVVRFGEPTR